MLAFSFLVHDDEPAFRRLFERVYRPEHVYAAHVDLRAPKELKRFVAELTRRPNVFAVPSTECAWGGWSLVAAELELQRELLNAPGWSHCINLSGHCFPIRSLSEIETRLENLSASLIESRAVSLLSLNAKRFVGYHFEVRRRNRRRVIRLPLPRRRVPKGMHRIYKGSQWKILERSFCEFAQSSEASRELQSFFKRTFIPDEHFFPTLIRHPSYRGKFLRRNEHFVRWLGPRPEVLGEADLPDILDSDRLFARKLVSNHSETLWQRLEEAAPAPGLQKSLDSGVYP